MKIYDKDSKNNLDNYYNKYNNLIEELLGFYFIWIPIEILVLYIAFIKNKYSSYNYDVKTLVICELLYFPLKIIFSYKNNINYKNFMFYSNWYSSVISAIIQCAIMYLIFNSYNFNSNKEFLYIYLILV